MLPLKWSLTLAVSERAQGCLHDHTHVIQECFSHSDALKCLFLCSKISNYCLNNECVYSDRLYKSTK